MSHAFAILTIKSSKSENEVEIYVDYDGSIHFSDTKSYVNGTEQIMVKEHMVDMPFSKFLGELLTYEIPKYHHRYENCKNFSERVCIILTGEESQQYIDLDFYHRHRVAS